MVRGSGVPGQASARRMRVLPLAASVAPGGGPGHWKGSGYAENYRASDGD
jgi:hypothetical protein